MGDGDKRGKDMVELEMIEGMWEMDINGKGYVEIRNCNREVKKSA